MPEFKDFIEIAAGGKSLSESESAQAFELIMSGATTPAQIGAFLMALRVRGETVDEITGAVRTMRAMALKVDAPADAIDTCGTGGDASGTYNISTAACFVVAACGVPVAKSGNRALSSKSGTSQALEALGVKIDIPPAAITRCIAESGVGFMMAPLHHAAMKHVGPVRVELGIRTIFNLLGPLSNPAGTKRQLIGVFAEKWVEPLAHVLKDLGSERVWVVHGSDGLDELTTTGPSQVAELKNGTVHTFEITPEDAGLKRASPEDLRGGGPEENAAALKALLQGQKNAYRDIVILNSAAALIVAGKAKDISNGAEMAAAAIDSGAALTRLDQLIAASNA